MKRHQEMYPICILHMTYSVQAGPLSSTSYSSLCNLKSQWSLWFIYAAGLKIPAGSFVASMSKLIPRAYSIASIEPRYALVGGQNIPVTDILLEVVQFSSGPFQENEEICDKTGVCSNYLMKLPVGGRFLSYHHSNQQFKMPLDPNVPIVMISAGSGIAPFRAFWQQRSLLHWDKNSAWLYFGCRDENENLFEEETAKSVQRILAFSRKSSTKTYVQDLVAKDGDLIHDLIMNRKAHFYICGKVCTYNVVHCTFIIQRLSFILLKLCCF